MCTNKKKKPEERALNFGLLFWEARSKKPKVWLLICMQKMRQSFLLRLVQSFCLSLNVLICYHYFWNAQLTGWMCWRPTVGANCQAASSYKTAIQADYDQRRSKREYFQVFWCKFLLFNEATPSVWLKNLIRLAWSRISTRADELLQTAVEFTSNFHTCRYHSPRMRCPLCNKWIIRNL